MFGVLPPTKLGTTLAMPLAFGTRGLGGTMPAIELDSRPAVTADRVRQEPAVQTGKNGKLVVHFHQTPLRQALEDLFQASKGDYVLKSSVEADTVTCSLNNVTEETALRVILGAVKQHLTYRRDEDGVWMIAPK